MAEKQTFDQWMKEVDRLLSEKIVLVSDDIPDLNYMQMYQTGKTPQYAVRKALNAACD